MGGIDSKSEKIIAFYTIATPHYDILLQGLLMMDVFNGLGSPEYPTRLELAQIDHASPPGVSTLQPEAGEEEYSFRFTIPPHGVDAVVVD